MRCLNLVLLALPILAFAGVAAAEPPMTSAEFLSQAAEAYSDGKVDVAFSLADKAVESDPKNAKAYFFRAQLNESQRRHKQAVADYSTVLELEPKAELYDRRGSEQFKLGEIEASIADFDKYIELVPEREPGHWKRGISYYYAGRFADGRKQFEGYQTVDENDVENAVWRYLCQARETSVDGARKSLLKIRDDRRVPMMEVYAMYAGEKTPDDVMAAARAGDPPADQLNERLFYAHLYLGLYHDAAGDKKSALEHIRQAADDHPIGHYMWDVARVHKKLLESPPDAESKQP
jgi:lipoprotein NlpI